MKHLILIATLFLSLTASAKAPSIAERIAAAADLIATFAEGSNTHKVTPGEAKDMLREFALGEGIVDDEADFESRWVGDSGDAWEVDSTNWGLEDAAGAKNYIEGALETKLAESEQTDADKVKYADGMLKTKQAFQVLRSIKSVRYGVSPTGAVQCGVTFPSLMIIDTQNGVMHEIIMEGSGC
jgi:hypothetical protein